MDGKVLHVPSALLRTSQMTASMKLVWMILRLLPSASAAELENYTGLFRSTVNRALAKVRRVGPISTGPRVRVPGALLKDRSLSVNAKVLYGLLQATPGFRGNAGQFTHASLGTLTGTSPNTLKKAVAELHNSGWIQASQAGRQKPIHFTLGGPIEVPSHAAAATASRRINRARHKGEAIMQEYLSLLIDSDQFTDNARPGYLVNPLTDERLEIDRLYAANVGFEYNGDQHERATEVYSQTEVDAQRLRDYIKAGICLYQGVRLIIVRAADLSLQGMLKKIGDSMPLCSLKGRERLIEVLEDASIRYWATVEAARRTGT